MRQSNTSYRNISFDRSRARYRVEMRMSALGSRTARVPTLVEALKLRDSWTVERNLLLQQKLIEKTAAIPVFSIAHGAVYVRFD